MASTPATDLSAKYSKLATEYAKVRAQLGVVKKAVVEEQSRSGELAETLKLRESQMRKDEQERESLTFRNQQLTKRVEMLLDEAEQKQLSAAKKRGASSSGFLAHKHQSPSAGGADPAAAAAAAVNSVFAEELQAKIAENAKLHARLNEVDDKHAAVIASLESRTRDLENEARRQRVEERAEDANQKELINALKAEKVEFMTQMQQTEKDLIDAMDRITVLHVQLESAAAASSSSSRGSRIAPHGGATTPAAALSPHAEKDAQERGAETNGGGGGGRGAVSHSRDFGVSAGEARAQTGEILSQVGETLQELIAAFSDFHTYWEHRLKDAQLATGGGPLSEQSKNLSRLLLQNVKYLKPIEETYQKVLSSVLSRASGGGGGALDADVRDFARSFNAYVSYFGEIEPLMAGCIRQDSQAHSCPASQKQQNESINAEIKNLSSWLRKIGEYLSDLTESDADFDRKAELVESLTAGVANLQQHAAELSDVYAAKCANENQLPTVTDQLKNTNLCIGSSLSAVSTNVGVLSSILSDNRGRIRTLMRSRTRDGFPAMAAGEATTMRPASTSDEAPVDSGSGNPLSDDLLVAQRTIEEQQEEIDKLSDRITSLEDKMKQTEQTKEHWKLEYQLLQMKYEKTKKDLDHGASEGEDEAVEMDFDVIFADREEELKIPFNERIKDLVSEKMLADSKATSFYLDNCSLRKRIQATEIRRKKMEALLESSKAEMQTMKEEIKTTRTNYEMQLSMMSEHVANMNDKLSSQADQVQNLKYELATKEKKNKR